MSGVVGIPLSPDETRGTTQEVARSGDDNLEIWQPEAIRD
jgi:hypothetical protein